MFTYYYGTMIISYYLYKYLTLEILCETNIIIFYAIIIIFYQQKCLQRVDGTILNYINTAVLNSVSVSWQLNIFRVMKY